MTPSGDAVAASRMRFLTTESARIDRVRGPILASWQRSRELRVHADRIDLPYIGDPEVDTCLTRSARPVLRSLQEQLDGQPVSIILTDPTGLVLSRMTADRHLERHLDSVRLAPGFSYGEQYAGTNGIGTALEAGGPTHVFGHEHYAENLEDPACAGVPIHHPVSGRTIGAVALTCWRKDAGSLLLTLAKTTAEQIRRALLADTGVHYLELLHDYLRACHRMSGIVFAVSNDMVLLNAHTRALLDPVDQAALLAHATDTLGRHQNDAITVGLPTGMTARMQFHHLHSVGQHAGVVVHVTLGDPVANQTVPREMPTPMPLPGLVGSAPLWLRACDEVEQVFTAGEWLVVAGEPGVGKLALLRTVQLRGDQVGRFMVFDAADAATDPHWMATVRRALLTDADNVAIRHIDLLDGPQLRALSCALQDARAAERERPLWVSVTLQSTAGHPDLAPLLRWFPRTVEVPPLRLHLEDLQQLVSFFLAKLGPGGQLACSPAAMRLLMRSPWPGNAQQLQQMLREVVKHRRVGSIEPDDLPPEARTVSRRLLNPLESIERDAIVRSLADAGGNKQAAAGYLGISRATIYRKIREYGIVTA